MKTSIALACFALASASALAAEGMWPLDKLPLAHYARNYGFAPDADWSRHVQSAAARIVGGGDCSAGFVSPNGLVVTNHHCLRSCLQALTTASSDLVRDGFYAKEQRDERRCEAFEIDRLEDVTDVTQRIARAVQGLDGDAWGKAQQAAQARIKSECVGRAGAAVRCDVVKLYDGAIYSLYKYRRYQDVRLVFSPEDAAAPDCGNDLIDFPCHSFDAGFLRVYDGDRPARVRDWFGFDRAGVRPGDLTLLVGHPGSTERSRTLAQLERTRDTEVLPALVWASQARGMLDRFAAESADHARVSAADRARFELVTSRYRAEWQILQDPAFLRAKRQEEQALRDYIDADPQRRARYAHAWDKLDAAESWYRTVALRDLIIADGYGFGSLPAVFAYRLVRAADERARPDAERLDGYHDAQLPASEQFLRAERNLDAELEQAMLARSLAAIQEWLGAGDPLVVKLLGGEAPDALAARLIKNTRLGDAAVRIALWQGGQAAIDASDDPLIALFRKLEPDIRRLLEERRDQFEAVEDRNAALIAQARFERDGTNRYPDATFTLRVADGRVEGVNGGPATASIGGAFANAGAPGAMKVPDTWLKAKAALDAGVPLNFETTDDTIGGNSGSPVLSRDGRLVGLLFAGNRAADQGAYWYDATRFRAIVVDARGILELLDKVYGAKRLIEEMAPPRRTSFTRLPLARSKQPGNK